MDGLCQCGCGAIVTPRKSFVSGHNGRGRRKPRVVVSCAQCGSTFSGTAAAMSGRLYCSSECRDKHWAERPSSEHPAYKSIELDCAICGKHFAAPPARLKHHQVYCSMECGREGRRRKISGEARKSRPYGTRKAKVRDHFSCRICGFDLAVHAHHIIHRKNAGSSHIDNLITLCPNHHALAHAGVLTEEEMRAALLSPLPVSGTLRIKATHAINYRA